MPVVVEGQLTMAEFLRAQYLHLRPRPWVAIVGGVILGASLFVIGLSWALRSSERGIPSSAVVLLGVLLYLAILFFGYLPWRFRRLFTQQKGLHGSFRLEFADGGVSASTAHGQAQCPWSHIHKWKEGRHLLLLYFSDAMFAIVPKRCFGTKEQLHEFTTLLSRNARRAT